jgi:PAS domain S-box-containing protein
LLLGIGLCAVLIASSIGARILYEARAERKFQQFHDPALIVASEMKAALASLHAPDGVADSYVSDLSSEATFAATVTRELDRAIELGERLLGLYQREADPRFESARRRLGRAVDELRAIEQESGGDLGRLARRVAASRPYASIVAEQLIRLHRAASSDLRGQHARMDVRFNVAFAVLFLLLAAALTLLARRSFHGIDRILAGERAAMDALGQSEERFRKFFQLGLVGMSITRPDKHWEQFNDRLCDMVGYTPQEMRTLTWADFTHPDDLAADEALYQRVLIGQIESYTIDKRYVRKDGQIIYVTIALGCERDAQGRVERFFNVIVDVTRRKHAELQLQRHRDDLERLVEERTRDLIAARDAAQRASRAKSEFLSRMSHELRTPLNAILGFAQILRLRGASLTPAQRDQQTGHIETAGWHLLELINEVLDLSRIEAGTMAVGREPVPLQELCAKCRQLLEPLTRAAGVTVLDRTQGVEPLWAFGDRTRLNQILMNLLSNAAKYNRRGGSITVTLRAIDENWVEIGVEDTGRGFTSEQLSQLYEPFNRLGAEPGTTEGTGIGLVVTKRLTEMMGGVLDLVTTKDVGSRFTVRLRRAREADAASPPANPLAAGASHPPRGVTTLLCVEDNPANVEVVRSSLALRPEWRLVEAPDGPTGLALAAAKQPDLIMIDIVLPGIDGYEVCRRLRERAETAKTPIIAVSANVTQADIERGEQAGFDCYLTKPIDVERLLAHIDKLLAGRVAGPEADRSSA